jgi:hypothetical protein
LAIVEKLSLYILILLFYLDSESQPIPYHPVIRFFLAQFIEPIEDLEACCKFSLGFIAVSKNGGADIALAFDRTQERPRHDVMRASPKIA